jgi:hypothetical protein
MPRSKLFDARLSEAEMLRVLREFLEWLYGRHRSVEIERLAFWKCWSGLTTEQIVGPASEPFDRMLQLSRDWNWGKHRKRWLGSLERAKKGLRVEVPAARYTLSPIKSAAGRMYFRFCQVLPPKFTEDAFANVVLEEMLRLLDRLAMDALGRCPICQHLFLRLRAGRRLYCSQSCKQKSLYGLYYTQPSAPGRAAKRRGQ